MHVKIGEIAYRLGRGSECTSWRSSASPAGGPRAKGFPRPPYRSARPQFARPPARPDKRRVGYRAIAIWLDEGMSLPLDFHPALSRPDLLAAPVAAALRDMPGASEVRVAPIDPALADTAAFCERYGIAPEESANCVVIAAKRGGETTYAACLVAATTRADVNGLVRRHLGARKASFGSVDAVTAATGME